MTDDERKMLHEMHAALLQVPTGAPTGTKPLLQEIHSLVIAYKRAGWVTRSLIWFVLTAAAFLAGADALMSRVFK